MQDLPPLDAAELARRLAPFSPIELSSTAIEGLLAHYEELRRWNRHLSLIGPREGPELFSRHYGESLAALPLLPEAGGTLLDLGSGAGFPGLVIAIARRDLHPVLVESRQRKWSFLMSVCRRAALPCTCLNVRVDRPLPGELPSDIRVLTARAVALEGDLLTALTSRLAPGARVLVWAGKQRPEAPAELRLVAERALAGGQHRRILCWRYEPAPGSPTSRRQDPEEEREES